jgi:uncharacterized protein
MIPYSIMYLRRTLEGRLRRYLELFPAVFLTGPRQSGKSTLVRAALPDYPYLSFDDPEEARAAELDPRGFLARFPEKAIFDEAQRAPNLFPYLKMAIDGDRQRRGRFVLTGSNQFTLSRRVSESLAGRIGLLSLYPFERSEIPEAARARQMLRGSYPELVTRNYDGAREWYSSYLATYLERDVRAFAGVGKLSDFQGLVRLLAARVAQEYNASALARDIGVDSKTVEAWVSVLEASFILFRLRPWHANIGKRLVKRPKLFFWDTGLACYLAGLRDEEALAAGPLAGPVFENLVTAEILKGAAHRGVGAEAFYFRESNGLEADLILIDREQGRCAVMEMKAGATAKAPWSESVARVADLVAPKTGKKGASETPRRVVVYSGETKRDWPAPGTDFLNFEDAIAEWQT